MSYIECVDTTYVCLRVPAGSGGTLVSVRFVSSLLASFRHHAEVYDSYAEALAAAVAVEEAGL